MFNIDPFRTSSCTSQLLRPDKASVLQLVSLYSSWPDLPAAEVISEVHCVCVQQQCQLHQVCTGLQPITTPLTKVHLDQWTWSSIILGTWEEPGENLTQVEHEKSTSKPAIWNHTFTKLQMKKQTDVLNDLLNDPVHFCTLIPSTHQLPGKRQETPILC